TRPRWSPREPFDVTVHIVLNDFGPLGRPYVEADETDADEATIVENLLSGQYSHPVRVIAFNTVKAGRGTRRTESRGNEAAILPLGIAASAPATDTRISRLCGGLTCAGLEGAQR
ncbi:MAG: hypothetical protein WAL01_21285, partial [Pseudolabrys sp.]